MNKKTLAILAISIAAITGTSVMASSADNKEVDGKISNAIAFASEHDLVEGTVEDGESGFYYDSKLLDSKDDTYTIGSKYGTKYVIMGDKLFDLDDGDIVEDDIKDLDYNATKAFKTALKGVSRYSVKDVADIHNQERQLQDRFGDVWYKAEVNRDGEDGTSFIFYNESKGVLDLSYKANFYFYDKEAAKTIKVSEFGKEDDGYTANMTSIKMIAQDTDNLYFIADIEVSKTAGGANSLKYIIKTNKSSQSDSSVKYPSSINSYLVSDSSITTTSFTKLASLVNEAKEFTVNGGDLLAIKSTGSDVAVSQITLGKGSVAVGTETAGINLYIGAIGDSDSLNNLDYSIASDGKVWSIYKGDVMYYKSGEFKESFSVDTSLNKLDVYDDNNAVCWADDSDVFETRTGSSDDIKDSDVTASTTDTKGETNTTTTSADSGLGTTSGSKDTTVSYQGHWEFGATKDPKWIDVNGKAVANQWVYSNNGWYYVNAAGTATKDWAQIGNAWYHFDGTNKMQTGWQEVGGNWYFFGGNGSMVTGWQSDSGSWYYLNETSGGSLGMEMSGWITVGNDWYLLSSNGVMRTGWVKDNGLWFYFNYQGKMLKDCVVDGYYLGLDGSVQAISQRLNSELNKVKANEGTSQTSTGTQNTAASGSVNYGTGTTTNSNTNNNSVNLNNSAGAATFGATTANGQPIK